jgi:hypothetical protein
MKKISFGNKKRVIVFICIYLFIFLFILESLSFVLLSKMRAVDQFRELGMTGSLDPRVIYALHPYYGFTRDPSQCPGSQCNRFGFIGDELPLQRSDDTVFIGIFGGSLAGKLCAYDRNKFAETLQRYPFFKDKKVQFACIALGGFKQPQQLLALSYFLSLGRKFDIVINLDGFNEIALPLVENIPARVEFSYPGAWNMYIRQDLDIMTLAQIRRIEELRQARQDLQRALPRGILAHSNFVKLVLAMLERVEVRKNFQLYRDLLVKSEKEGLKEYQMYGPKEEYKDSLYMLERSVALWRESSKQMANLCAANKIPYFHFLQPNQYSGMKKLTPNETTNAYSDVSPYKNAVKQGYPLLVREGQGLQKDGVPFFDLTTIFMNEEQDIYADSCCHVTPAGNEILMETIAKTIGQRINTER